jgi:hypothetical protein
MVIAFLTTLNRRIGRFEHKTLSLGKRILEKFHNLGRMTAQKGLGFSLSNDFGKFSLLYQIKALTIPVSDLY